MDYSKFLNIIDRDNVNSIESQVAKLFYKEVFGKSFRRHRDDEINFLLNYGYAVLRSKIRQLIISKGLHPSIGLEHNNQFNNFNLSDDIIEVYRSIVDYIVFELISLDTTKENSREVLQQVILQDVKYNNSRISLVKSIELFIDGIIRYMNGKNNNIIIPELEVEYYEYQI